MMTGLTDRDLATKLMLAERDSDTDAIIGYENEIADRIGLSPDDTEQGLTQHASDQIDHWLRKTLGVPIRGRKPAPVETDEDAATELYEQVQDLKQLLQRWMVTSKLSKAEKLRLRRETHAALRRSSSRVMVDLANAKRQ